MVFILTSKLGDGNSITLDPGTKEPIIRITRTEDHNKPAEKAAMATMTNNAMKAVAKTLNVRFDNQRDIPPGFVPPLKLGFWAHELGSLPMPGADPRVQSVLDVNLALRGGYKGVSVCDNSVFPFSPSANPSLTLAALALRLSAHISRRPQRRTPSREILKVGSGLANSKASVTVIQDSDVPTETDTETVEVC
jgi:choline dehydrogenase-like flavoprotein